MTDERGFVELERIENLFDVSDERLDRVLSLAERLEREAVAFDIDRDRAEACVRDHRKIPPIDIDRASPTRYEQNRRRGRVSSFNDAHLYSGAKPRIMHAIGGVARRKHLAGTQTSATNGSDHQIRSARFLCRGVSRSNRCGR